MRLIDVDALIGSFATIAKKLARSDAQKALMGRVMYILEHKPEDVVRCRECRYRQDRLYCRRLKEHPFIVTNTDFCSYGERKEE